LIEVFRFAIVILCRINNFCENSPNTAGSVDGLLPGWVRKYINLTIFSDYFRLSNDKPASKAINPKTKLTIRIPDLLVGLLSLMDHQNNPPLSIIPAMIDISPKAVKSIPSKDNIIRNLCI